MQAVTVLSCGVVCLAACALPSQRTLCQEGEGTAELYGSLACDLCGSRSCCAEALACAGDEDCNSLMHCLRGCASAGEACFRECHSSVENGEDGYRMLATALIDCVSGNCESDTCTLPERAAGSCPDAGTIPDVFGSASCSLCIRREACGAAIECLGRGPCATRMACMSGCLGDDLSPACFDQCRDDALVETGDAPYFQVVAKECRPECSLGSQFECVGAFAWPTTTLENVSVSMLATNRTAGVPFAGLEVRACSSDPGPHVTLDGPQTTDVDGMVTLSLPTKNGFETRGNYSGFRGYLQITDPTPMTSLDWLETTLYRTRPEYRDRVADEPAPFAPGTLLETLFTSISNAPPAVMLMPDRGILLGGIFDCRGNIDFFARDIAVNIAGADAATRVVYINAAQLGVDYQLTATSIAGQFMAINVPVGAPEVTFVHVPTGRTVARTTPPVVAGLRPTIIGTWPLAELD